VGAEPVARAAAQSAAVFVDAGAPEQRATQVLRVPGRSAPIGAENIGALGAQAANPQLGEEAHVGWVVVVGKRVARVQIALEDLKDAPLRSGPGGLCRLARTWTIGPRIGAAKVPGP